MGDDRPIRYVEPGAGPDGEDLVVYRASGLMSCERIFLAHANGHIPAPTPAFLQEIYDEGHAFEDLIRQMYVERENVEVFDDQREVTLDLGSVKGAHVVVRGHIDNLSRGDGLVSVVDYKKIRESGWDDFCTKGIEIRREYPWQMSVYMHALAQEGVKLGGWELIGGKVVEVDGDGDAGTGRDLVDLKIHQGIDAPISLKAIRQRVARIEGLIADGFDAPEVDCDGGNYPCPFFYLHDEKPEDEVFEWGEDEGGEIEHLLGLFHEASEARKSWDATRKEVTKAIYALIEDAGQDADRAKKLVGYGFEVTRTRGPRKGYWVKDSMQDYLKIAPIKSTETAAEKALADSDGWNPPGEKLRAKTPAQSTEIRKTSKASKAKKENK